MLGRGSWRPSDLKVRVEDLKSALGNSYLHPVASDNRNQEKLQLFGSEPCVTFPWLLMIKISDPLHHLFSFTMLRKKKLS